MKIALILLRVVKLFLDFCVKPIIRAGFQMYYKNLDYLKPLPKCKSPILLLPANVLSKKIRSKEVNLINELI